MSAKVLLADDSSTIRKVVRITLANEGHEIIDCESHSQLFQLVKEHAPELILLDFNLSDTQNGYELTRTLIKLCPGSRVLMMFGTFDVVDESELRKSGASDRVIKPFDSNKFVSICRSLIDEAKELPRTVNEIELSKPASPVVSDKKTDEVAPMHDEEIGEEIVFEASTDLSPKERTARKVEEVWDGITIPGVIGNAASANSVLEDIPGVIESASKTDTIIEFPKQSGPKASATEKLEKDDDVLLPAGDDLDYPDLDDWANSSSASPQAQTSEPKKSKLVPLNELSFDDTEPEEHSPVSNPMYGTPSERTEEELKKLEEEISAEISDADIWAPDENVSSEGPPTQSVTSESRLEHDDFELSSKSVGSDSEGIDEIDLHSSAIDDSLDEIDISSNRAMNPAAADVDSDGPSPASESSSSASSVVAIDENALRETCRPIIEKLIHEMVRDYCQQSLEKVAWDVIPDLAENLIKQELRTIAESVAKES